jgi:ribonuclease HII
MQQNALTLVDGNKLIKNFTFPQKCIIKGDSKSASIAASSILAKVTRDRYMEKLHEEFPMYNWIKNAGYLTKEHLDAIDKYGLTKYHRPSFLRKHFEQSKQLSLMQ